ncbi:MAG: ABC transporter transmembrane domain-containing protein, partial [Myxococcota bacterium]|nr:ABC transporter transmembrane domain-containing protein [Myxococcota bacterium]
MSRRENVKKMLRLSQSQWKPLAAGTFFLFVAAGLNLSFPMLIGFLIDDIEFGSQAGQETLNGYILSLLGLFFFVGIATFFRAYLFVVAGERIVANLRRDVFAALIGQEIGFFDLNRTGSLTNRLASDTTVVQNAVTVNLSMALRFSLSGLGSILILFYMSWQLTLVMLITVPLVAVAATYYGRMLQRISVKVQDALADSTAIAEEGFSNIRTVRAFARETFEQKRYGAAVEQSFQIAKKRALIAASFQGLLSFAGYGAICGVLWYGGLLLIEGKLAFGALTSFILYTFTVAFSISALSGLFGDFAKALGASERIFSFLDRATTIQDGQREVVEAKGNLRFQDVVFAYPTRPDFPVLRTFSLSLSNGEVVALVGPSGGGKSTVAALVSRFYDPQSGIITFDDVPIHELKKDWLRAQLGIVSQEPILFATSILDNIRY